MARSIIFLPDIFPQSRARANFIPGIRAALITPEPAK
jgi:hypothetical protein